MIRKTLVTLALSAGMVAGTAGVASAHECFVASRSAQGNAAATHSANWVTLPLADLFAHAHHFLDTDRPLTPAEVETAVGLAVAEGVPASFTLFERQMLPASPKELEQLLGRTRDGKGIDHFVAAYGEDIIGIYLALAFPETD